MSSCYLLNFWLTHNSLKDNFCKIIKSHNDWQYFYNQLLFKYIFLYTTIFFVISITDHLRFISNLHLSSQELTLNPSYLSYSNPTHRYPVVFGSSRSPSPTLVSLHTLSQLMARFSRAGICSFTVMSGSSLGGPLGGSLGASVAGVNLGGVINGFVGDGGGALIGEYCRRAIPAFMSSKVIFSSTL